MKRDAYGWSDCHDSRYIAGAMAAVLIVDGNEDVAEVYRAVLESDGHEVACAIDGESALRRVVDFRPDVVVLDTMMPGVDGLSFLDWLEKVPAITEGRAPAPRVIATSGFAHYHDEAVRRGAHAFLSKPVTAKLLLAAVAAAASAKAVPADELGEHEREITAARERSRDGAVAVIAQLADLRAQPIHGALQALVEWLHRYYGFGACFLHLVHGDKVYLAASFGTDPKFLAPGMEYPRENVYCGDVIDAGSTLYLSDPLRHPVRQFSEHNEVKKRGWHLYIGAPLTAADGAVLGTLCLMDREPRDLHTEDVRLFERLAGDVAATLVETAHGRTASSLIDAERVFVRAALDILLTTALRRVDRNGGKLRLARLRLQRPDDIVEVTRKAYGLTSGLRFAVIASSAEHEWLFLHDGSEPDIVDNNLDAVQQLIAPALRSFVTVAWPPPGQRRPRAPLTTIAEPMSARTAQSIATSLFSELEQS